MKRLTEYEIIAGLVHDIPVFEMQNCAGVEEIIKRLAAIEDILGDDYDLDRLRELVEADREGRCVVLPRLEPGQGDPPGELGPQGPPGIAD